MRDYPMVILPLSAEDGGGYQALFPDLPGCLSDGETPGEAAENGHDAMRAWIEVWTESGRPLPEPSPVPMQRRA